MTTLIASLICLTAVAALTILGLTLWMWDRATKRWMMMFCEKLSIPQESMEGKSASSTQQAIVQLMQREPERKKRFSVPLPGAEMFRKEKTQ